MAAQNLQTIEVIGTDPTTPDRLGPTAFIKAAVAAGRSVTDAVRALRADPRVEWAEPNGQWRATGPNDPYCVDDPDPEGNNIYDQWGFLRVNADQAWDERTATQLVTVAVLDTGFDFDHPEGPTVPPNCFGSECLWTNEQEIGGIDGFDDDGNGYVDDKYGIDFVRSQQGYEDVPGYDGDPNVYAGDPDSSCGDGLDNDGDGNADGLVFHGTHVAGIVNMRTNNGVMFAGAGWYAQTMVVRVLCPEGNGSWADIAAGINYAADNGADVLNLSLGGGSYSSAVETAVMNAYAQGCVIVCAAGNDGTGSVDYPARFSETIAVGASDPDDQRASFSNWGPEIDVVAPGVRIFSLAVISQAAANSGEGSVGDPTYYWADGTSMATPFVTALAANIYAKYCTPAYGGISNEEVRDIIRRTARDLTGTWDGAGLIDFLEALRASGTGDRGPTRAVTWFDYDDDGKVDLYAADEDGPSVLYRQQDQGFFLRRTPWAGVGNPPHNAKSAALADYDRDGALDLFVLNWDGAAYLYRNNGDGTFTDAAATAGVVIPDGGGTPAEGGLCTCWADYDLDGDSDLFVGRELTYPELLYRNNGDGTFTEVGTAAGLANADQCRAAAWADYDADGDPDLYVGTGGGGNPNRLYRNEGDGTFTDVAADLGVADNDPSTPNPGGCVWGDFDNDADLDLFVNNLDGPNRLFRNDGTTFTEVGSSAGVADTGEAAGCAFLDFDLDGDLDLYVTRGSSGDLFYVNNGNGTFTESASGLGITTEGTTYAVATADPDRDGDLDIYLGVALGGNCLWRNDGGTFFYSRWPAAGGGFPLYRQPVAKTSRGNWLSVRPQPTQSSPDGIGTRVTIVAGGQRQVREISGGTGSGQDELVAHFGLGGAAVADTVTVQFPVGGVVVQTNVPAGAEVTVTEPEPPFAGFFDDFEDGDISDWTTVTEGNGIVEATTDEARNGFWSLRSTDSGNARAEGRTPELQAGYADSNYTLSTWFMTPSAANHWLAVLDNGHVHLVLDYGTDLKAYWGSPASLVQTLTAGQWYRIRADVRPAEGEYDVYVDDQFRLTALFLLSSPRAFVRVGDFESGSANYGTGYWDDLRLSREEGTTTVAEQGSEPPGPALLFQNHPNPFNPKTTIGFRLPSRAEVKLEVFDLAGRLVRTLSQGTLAAGLHAIQWRGRDNHGRAVGSGTYLYRLSQRPVGGTGSPVTIQTRKLTLMK